jgi:hypothetical protein
MGWSPNMRDVDWIAECGSRNWIIVSGDKAIQEVPEERQAVINSKCKVFMFDDGNITRTEDWAAAFLVGREKIVETALRGNGPFFVTIKPIRARGHVSQPRFIEKAGGGWRPADAPPEVPQAEPEPAAKQEHRQQQYPFVFQPK